MFSYGYKTRFIQENKYIDVCRVFRMIEVKVPTICCRPLTFGNPLLALLATACQNMSAKKSEPLRKTISQGYWSFRVKLLDDMAF
jgi:hypothetical protein